MGLGIYVPSPVKVGTKSGQSGDLTQEVVLSDEYGSLMGSNRDASTVFVNGISDNWTEVFISPTGNDSNSGLYADQAMKTPTAACEKYRGVFSLCLTFLPGTHNLVSGVSPNGFQIPSRPYLMMKGGGTSQAASTILNGPIAVGENGIGFFGMRYLTVTPDASGETLINISEAGHSQLFYVTVNGSYSGTKAICGIQAYNIGTAILREMSIQNCQQAVILNTGVLITRQATISNTCTNGYMASYGAVYVAGSTNSATGNKQTNNGGAVFV